MREFTFKGTISISDFDADISVGGVMYTDSGDRLSPPTTEYEIYDLEVISVYEEDQVFDKSSQKSNFYWNSVHAKVYKWLTNNIDQWVDNIIIY